MSTSSEKKVEQADLAAKDEKILDSIWDAIGKKEAKKPAAAGRPANRKSNGRIRRGVVMLTLPAVAASSLLDFSDKIVAADLGDDGIEDEPHVTVLYGITTDDAEAVKKVVENFGAIRFKFGRLSLFTNPRADILKVDIESADLQRLHRKIKENLPVKMTHSTYKPHATIAFLKPGAGRKYLKYRDSIESSESAELLVADRAIFSDSVKVRTTIRLS